MDLGLTGRRAIVTGASNVRENLIRCVQKADVEVDDLVLSPLAAAEARPPRPGLVSAEPP